MSPNCELDPSTMDNIKKGFREDPWLRLGMFNESMHNLGLYMDRLYGKGFYDGNLPTGFDWSNVNDCFDRQALIDENGMKIQRDVELGSKLLLEDELFIRIRENMNGGVKTNVYVARHCLEEVVQMENEIGGQFISPREFHRLVMVAQKIFVDSNQ